MQPLTPSIYDALIAIAAECAGISKSRFFLNDENLLCDQHPDGVIGHYEQRGSTHCIFLLDTLCAEITVN